MAGLLSLRIVSLHWEKDRVHIQSSYNKETSKLEYSESGIAHSLHLKHQRIFYVYNSTSPDPNVDDVIHAVKKIVEYYRK